MTSVGYCAPHGSKLCEAAGAVAAELIDVTLWQSFAGILPVNRVHTGPFRIRNILSSYGWKLTLPVQIPLLDHMERSQKWRAEQIIRATTWLSVVPTEARNEPSWSRRTATTRQTAMP